MCGAVFCLVFPDQECFTQLVFVRKLMCPQHSHNYCGVVIPAVPTNIVETV